jgi:hypothetical protein
MTEGSDMKEGRKERNIYKEYIYIYIYMYIGRALLALPHILHHSSSFLPSSFPSLSLFLFSFPSFLSVRSPLLAKRARGRGETAVGLQGGYQWLNY